MSNKEQTAFVVHDEADLMMSALTLDQSTDPTRRAGARFMREVTAAYVRWLDAELKGWNSTETVTLSIEAFAIGLGSMIASTAMTAAHGNTSDGKHLAANIVGMVQFMTDRHVEKMCAMAGGGDLTSENFKSNS